ncbi:MAG: hypothetical protein JKY54_18450, partial [Flavobacteriales bacterium]|nr:hypothetical protein [Flavobacteriales bacterium]
MIAKLNQSRWFEFSRPLKVCTIKVLLLFALLSSIHLAQSQSPSFQHFTSNDGLPSTQVYDIYQDVNGYLWFATDRGIASYDGYKFKSYGTKDGLTCNTVFKFYPQNNGDIWCSTMNNRLFVFNTQDYKFRPYEHNDSLQKYASDNTINDLVVLPDQTIHLAYIVAPGILTVTPYGDVIKPEPLDTTHDIRYLILERTNTNEILSYIEHYSTDVVPHTNEGQIISHQKTVKNGYRKGYQLNNISLLSDYQSVYVKNGDSTVNQINTGYPVLNLGRYDDDHFWVAYRNNGIKVFNLKGQEVISYLESESATFLLTDHEGGIWISTLTSGIFHAKNPSIKTIQTEGSQYVRSLSSNGSQDLWVSYYDGPSVQFRNDTSIHYLSVSDKTPSIITHHPIHGLVRFQNGLVYLHDTILNLNTPSINRISEEDKETILIAAHHSFIQLDKNMKLKFHHFTRRIYDVHSYFNQFLIATQTGLFVYDPVTLESEQISHRHLKFRIQDIDKRKGQYYFATIGNGVVMMDENDTISITTANGLYSNSVNEIYIENDSTIWAGTNFGLNKISFDSNGDYTISGISAIDGLPNNEVTDLEILNNTIWVGTKDGLCFFPKTLVNTANQNAELSCYLKITGVEVNEKPSTIEALGNLSHNQNHMVIHFQGVSFKTELTYRYKIEGLDNSWHTTSERSISRLNLPPGSYQFLLQESRDGLSWLENKDLSFPIFISPPFYKTIWFIALMLVIVVLLFYLFFKINILSYNRTITRELLRHLLKRIRPKSNHFTVRTQGDSIKLDSNQVDFIK